MLSAYADAVSQPNPPTLFAYIIGQLNQRATHQLSVRQAERLFASWPTLVVLDGLDEVAHPQIRAEVLSRIADFSSEMATVRADLFLVCTSRPGGLETAALDGYDRLQLVALSASNAIDYARRLVSCRHPDNPARQDDIVERLRTASNQSETAKLLSTPLQVTILTLLLEARTRAPSSRYTLFNTYYEIVYAREINKAGEMGVLLEQHRSLIDSLHERCALEIHRRSESGLDADSILPAQDMAAIARALLAEDVYDESRETLIERLRQLSAERLVLLVPRGEGVGFEVRTLTELFAARALTVVDNEIETVLAAMAPSAHWRNTWLLAAGRIFGSSDRRPWRPSVGTALDRADHANAFNRLLQPGAEAAVDALLDGFAAQSPQFEADLVRLAMRMLDGPIGPHLYRLAHALVMVVSSAPALDNLMWTEARIRLESGSLAVRAFLSSLAAVAGNVGDKATEMLARHDEARSGNAGQIPVDPLEFGLKNVIDETDLAVACTPVSSSDPRAGQIRQSRETLALRLLGDLSAAGAARTRLSEALMHDVVSDQIPKVPRLDVETG